MFTKPTTPRLNNRMLVRKHLMLHGHLSPMEALLIYGIVRLAPRIRELREQGYNIRSVRRRDAANVPYVRYEIE